MSLEWEKVAERIKAELDMESPPVTPVKSSAPAIARDNTPPPAEAGDAVTTPPEAGRLKKSTTGSGSNLLAVPTPVRGNCSFFFFFFSVSFDLLG